MALLCEWEPGWKPPSTPRAAKAAASTKPYPNEPDSLRVGLVGHWTFDEGTGTTARDSSGKGNDGKIVGGANWVKGKVGGALEFDGKDDCVDLGAGPGPLMTVSPEAGCTGDYTIALWFNVDRPYPQTDKRNPDYHFLTVGHHHFSLSGKWGIISAFTALKGNLGKHSNGKYAVHSNHPNGTWGHYAFVFDRRGSNYRLYKDGKFDYVADWSDPAKRPGEQGLEGNDWGGPWIIGKLARGTVRYYKGLLDDVRMYNRALSAEEIRLLAHPEEWAKAEPAPPSATRALDALLAEFDSLMARGDHAAAREWAEKAAGAPENAAAKEALEAAARVAKALADRPAAVRRGAEALVGKDIELRLKTGTIVSRTSGKVKEVTDYHLVVAATYTINRQPRERLQKVAWSALHPEQEDDFAEKGGWNVPAAERAIARAYVAFSAGDLDTAEAAADQAKGHPLAEYLMGRVVKAKVEAAHTAAMHRAKALVRLRNWQGAVESLEEALRVKPDDAEATKLLAEAESRVGPAPTLTLDLGNNVTMEFVYIKPGVFMMGDEAGRDDEKPAHEVAITEGFYVGKYEVIQSQYEAVTGGNPSNWKEPNRPVEQLTWNDAVEFCRLATGRTRRHVRLPTEAEWEYACRAASVGRYCFGSDETGLGDYAWYRNNSGGQTHPVGQKKPNAWGLYDMHGNVWELVADRYAAGYYARSPRENPKGPDTGRGRVVRGGSCWHDGYSCRSALRNGATPSRRYGDRGFRVAVSALPRASASAQAAYAKAIARAKMRVRLKNWKGAAEVCEEALKHKPGDPEAKKLLAEAESYIGPPKTLTLDLGGGVTMEMVYIKPGRFRMGFDGGEAHERPVHEVEITRGFYIGKYELTQAQATAVLGGRAGGAAPDQPAPYISWLEAMDFCRKASARTQTEVRLPTEAEWEYAARAGSPGLYCFGDDSRLLDEYAWHQGNARGVAHPVGGKKPNAWGLHDMHGNVWEWVADWHDAGYYASSPRKDPSGPATGTGGILRGGSWFDHGAFSRSSFRFGMGRDVRKSNLGIRVAVTVSPRTSASAQAAYDRALSRAKTRVRLKDWQGAVEACEEALKHKPGDPEAKKLLTEAESHIGPTPTLTLDLGRGVTMEFAYVKPGVFKMGGTEDPTHGWQGVEKPKHEVAITRAFYMGRYEVTQAQYEAVMGGNPSRWKEPTRPVEQVTWQEATEFCRLASERAGSHFRLPTEAEWEYACRAGSIRKWCFGSDKARLGEYAWHDKNSKRQTHPAGQKRANAWGLHDMHGNVWEWVADWYAADYYANSPRENPAGPETGNGRLLRGGSWRSGGYYCRSAIRYRSTPAQRGDTLGFRAVVSAVPRGR